MIEQIKHIKKKVTQLLTDTPHLRDDDNKLIATIWNEEMGREIEKDGNKGKFKSRFTTAFCFFEAFSSGQHTSPESIRRVRQKIQEQIPELRGTSYKNRKKTGTEFKKEICRV